jgi:hypothetical protein
MTTQNNILTFGVNGELSYYSRSRFNEQTHLDGDELLKNIKFLETIIEI